MHWKDFMTLFYFVIAAVIFGAASWITLPPDVILFAPVISLGLILIGLGVNSLVLVSQTDRKIKAINVTLENIEQIQGTIQKEQKEQKEQSGSHSMIVPTLQAFSQLYMDYLAKQQSGEEQQNK